ncbi:MAG: AMP-binding protein [Deltaproteobacteria bacterium]|nr:AMP-binding protein [Deltaproteobacteria bacterium]MBW1984640.1 AMP-binding protein [Deltaproteobacteria bacterium]MBW2180827.1 AMP-binding protein [Deltaproteobacteria bacterium]
MNLAQLAESALERLGERKSLVFDGKEYKNVELFDYSRRLHTAFNNLGMKKESNIVLCMMNNPMIYPVFEGIFRTGATAIPVMFLLTAPEVRYILMDSKAEGIVTDPLSVDKIREAVQGLDHIKWIIVLEGEDRPDASPREFTLETLLAADMTQSLPEIAGDDVAIMMYTSGTTGKPKGVMLTHDNLYAQGQASVDASELDDWEGAYISMSAMPMAHIFGVGVMLGGYLSTKKIADAGSYGVQMGWFEPEQFMALIQEYKCNVIPAVPTMLSLLLNHPNADKYDLSSLKEVICGASSLSEEVARTFSERYGCRVREIYGLTEASGLGSANRQSDPYKPGSAGKAYFNVELNIFDSNDQPLPPGKSGEIVMRGPTIMKGYYNLAEKTAEAMRSGWLHTGDIGYLDEEGDLFVVDRVKDMIIRGGENIYPAELEDIIYRFPGVAEAAIVGTPDPTYGESIVAFIVASPGATLSGQEIVDFMKKETSSFKIPSKIHMVDALPKNPVGKILKRELREKALVME